MYYSNLTVMFTKPRCLILCCYKLQVEIKDNKNYGGSSKNCLKIIAN